MKRIRMALGAMALTIGALSASAGIPVALKPLPQPVFREDTAWAIPVKEFFSDPDSQVLSYSADSPDPVSAFMMGDSSLLIVPQHDWYGNFSLVILVTSKSGQTLSRTMQGMVYPVNDPPEPLPPRVIYYPEDSSADVPLSDLFFDPDGRIVDVRSDTVGFTVEFDGSRLRLRAPPDWNGQKDIPVVLTDDSGATARFTIIEAVTPVDDPPRLSALPEAAAIQANGKLIVDFSPWASDVDDSTASLHVEPVAQAGMRFRVSGLTLTVLPFARIDTVTVFGAVVDPKGGKAPFSFKVYCNAGFRENALSLWPNLPMSYPREPAVLVNADGSWDAITAADSAVFLNRYRADGTQKAPGRALRLNQFDTVRSVELKRAGGKCFLLTTANGGGTGPLELRAFDGEFHETGKVDLSTPQYSTATMEIDTARARVLLARTVLVDTLQNATLTAYDYSLQLKASKLFHVTGSSPDSSPGRENLSVYRYMNELGLAVLPSKYALLWTTALRDTRYQNGIQYATLSPDLTQLDSARDLDLHVDDIPDNPVNDISRLRVCAQWGHLYLLWHVSEGIWINGGGLSFPKGPTIRLLRLDEALKPLSPIRRVNAKESWYLESETPQFIGNDVLVPWNTTDSYASTPREYYGVRYNADLTADSTALLAMDTLNYSPQRYLRDGRVYLVARVNGDGTLVASLAEGNIPSAIAGRPAMRDGKMAAASMKTAKDAGRRFDMRGRVLGAKSSVLATVPRR